MKKLVIVVVVLVAVLLLAPFGVGRMAESRLNKGLDKLVEQAPYLVIADRKWTGGWFKSEQLVTFEVAEPWAKAFSPAVLEKAIEEQAAAEAAPEAEADASADAAPLPETNPESVPEGQESAGEEPAPDAPPATAGEPVRFTVRNEVLHGPVLGLSGFGLARVDSHLDLSEKTKAEIAEIFGPKPALTTRTRVHFFGGATTTFASEGRTLKPKGENEEFTYEDFKLSLSVSRNADKYEVDGKLPSATGKGKDGGTFSLKSMTIEGEGERVVGDIYDGDVEFKVQEIKVTDASDAEGLLMQDLHYVVEADTKDGFMTMAARLGTGAVKGKDLASLGVEIKEIHYDFSLRHLHVESLDKMMKSVREVYAAPVVDPAQVENAFLAPMKAHAGDLLKHDPEFSFDRVGLVTPEGEGVLKGVIKFVGVTPEDFSGAGAMALVGKLDADLTIEVATKLVEKFPNGATMAGAAVDSGYAKREGDKLVCKILFKNGELTVNGKPQAIPGLGGPPREAMGEDPGAMPAPPQE